MQYSDPPVSWFQKQIRGQETTLIDHIAKEMNELNLERCKRIPKYPGADWRTLPDIKVLHCVCLYVTLTILICCKSPGLVDLASHSSKHV
jgi:hypothetical protein